MKTVTVLNFIITCQQAKKSNCEDTLTNYLSLLKHICSFNVDMVFKSLYCENLLTQKIMQCIINYKTQNRTLLTGQQTSILLVKEILRVYDILTWCL